MRLWTAVKYLALLGVCSVALAQSTGVNGSGVTGGGGGGASPGGATNAVQYNAGGGTLGGAGPGTAGQVLLSNGAGSPPSFGAVPGQFTMVAKAADTSRTSTTTLADDPDLQFTAQAAGTYSVEWEIASTGPTSTTNIKIALNCTGTVTTAFWYVDAIDQNGNRGSNAAQNACSGGTASATVSTAITAGNYEVVKGSAQVVTSTSGTISLQWAQGTSNVSALVFKQGSWMRISKIL